MIPSIAELRKYFDIYIFGGGHEIISCSIEIADMIFWSIEIAVDAIDYSECCLQNYISYRQLYKTMGYNNV